MTSDAMPQERPLETAVLFMVFNRPETTLRVFDAIPAARSAPASPIAPERRDTWCADFRNARA